MTDLFHLHVSARTQSGEPTTEWAVIVSWSLAPFAIAYLVAGLNPAWDVQFIAAFAGLAILGTALVVHVASAIMEWREEARRMRSSHVGGKA